MCLLYAESLLLDVHAHIGSTMHRLQRSRVSAATFGVGRSPRTWEKDVAKDRAQPNPSCDGFTLTLEEARLGGGSGGSLGGIEARRC